MTCSIDGCDKPVRYRGWCKKHVTRWERHGSPLVVLPRGTGIRGTAPAYRTMHQRVRRERGVPEAHPCIGCGRQAQHWAYDHDDPQEVTGPTSGSGRVVAAYSLNPAHYQPMCAACHRRFDYRGGPPPITHCKRGHEFTPENTYRARDGSRQCRECKATATRKAEARRKAARQAKRRVAA